MASRSDPQHGISWVNLLKDVEGTSWFEIAVSLYNKGHGHSNYHACKNRDYLAVRREVLEDEKVKQYIGNGVSNKQKVDKILDEMCHLLPTQSKPTRKLKLAGVPFLKCITKVYSSIYVNSVLLPREIGGHSAGNPFKQHYLSLSRQLPIVILPTHRSYMDFLLITYIMFHYELPLPIVAAGDNFKAMGKFLTNYLKGTGAFLIRRNAQSKKDIEAHVYFDILRAYMHSVIKGGENAIEFFLEGTRTRSGQVLRPKTGLLSMVVDMYLNGIVEDLYIMPASISYQHPIEEQLYVAETNPQLSSSKPKESAKNLISAFETTMKRKYGNVYIRFVEPFKISEYFKLWKDSTGNEITNFTSETLLHDFTNSLATTVCLAQAYNNVLMPFNLLSSSLLARTFLANTSDMFPALSGNTVQLKFSSLMEDFYSFEELLVGTQPQFSPGWKNNLDVIEEFKMNRDNIVRPSENRKHIEFNLNGTTFYTLLYYTNQLLQILLPVAICSLLTEENLSGDLPATRWEQYKSIRSLLSREFLIDDLSLEREFTTTMRCLEQKQITNHSRKLLLQLLAYYFQSHLLFLHYLQKHSALDKTEFYADPQNAYISKDMLRNMISLVTDLEICQAFPKSTVQIPASKREELLKVRESSKLAELTSRFQSVFNMAKNVIQS